MADKYRYPIVNCENTTRTSGSSWPGLVKMVIVSNDWVTALKLQCYPWSPRYAGVLGSQARTFTLTQYMLKRCELFFGRLQRGKKKGEKKRCRSN